MDRPTYTLNKELNGIEIKFQGPPSQATKALLREQRFFYHGVKKIWYAKDTPARREFADSLCGVQQEKSEQKASSRKEAEKKPEKNSSVKESGPNTFAASYDRIGDAAIVKDAEFEFSEHMEAFCEKEQLFYRRTYGGDSISIQDLSNAQKNGKTCDRWSVSGGWNEYLPNILRNANIETAAQLLDVCRAGQEIDGLSISHYEDKGVDVFSPFVEVKPLKELPEKWTKRNFTQALMSGQMFRGEVSYRYTDDYAMDAANDFGTGRGLDMASFAKREVGDWGSSTTCYNARGEDAGPDRSGAYQVSYSEYSNSGKTLWFDVNCDIAEGKRRAEARERALEKYNQMLESSCIQVDISKISREKVYTVESLDLNQNTGVYGSKLEHLQGDNLLDRLDPECSLMKVLSLKEMEIQPTLFYSVSNFHDRMSAAAPEDDRIIPVGNWEHIVSGKALLEMTAEGRYFPRIQPAYGDVGPTYEKALNNLTMLASGKRRFMLGIGQPNYDASIEKLTAEYVRAGGLVKDQGSKIQAEPRKRSFEDMLLSAKTRADAQSSGNHAGKSNILDFTNSK